MSDVLFTPSEELEPLLTLLATSKLHLSKDVALAGDSKNYWNAKEFYDRLDLSDNVCVKRILNVPLEHAISLSLSAGSILDRVSSLLPNQDIAIELPMTPILIENGPRVNSDGTERHE